MIIPILHRVLVLPENVQDANETFKKMKALGLAIPDSDLLKKEQAAVELGTIIAIGETAFVDFKATKVPVVGEKVLYAKYAGKAVSDGDTKYLVLNDEDIIGIIKENP